MKRSTERILTTHVGSLPRPDDLIRTMFAKQEGVPVDPVALEARTRLAVAATVKRQLDAGVDVVSDGEMSKPSYVTYISDRLDGFCGTSHDALFNLGKISEVRSRLAQACDWDSAANATSDPAPKAAAPAASPSPKARSK